MPAALFIRVNNKTSPHENSRLERKRVASFRPRSTRDRRRADLRWSAPELSCCLHTSSSSTCVLHAAAAGWGAWAPGAQRRQLRPPPGESVARCEPDASRRSVRAGVSFGSLTCHGVA